MAGIRALISLAFLASTGITLLVLGCALPEYNNWWPMFVLVFYTLSPVPTLIARRFADSVEMSSVLIEICTFITSCIVVSAYGLPIVLARAANVIQWGACGLVLAGNTVVFVTILMFFYFFGRDDSFEYSTW
jgi:hypothetical protein